MQILLQNVFLLFKIKWVTHTHTHTDKVFFPNSNHTLLGQHSYEWDIAGFFSLNQSWKVIILDTTKLQYIFFWHSHVWFCPSLNSLCRYYLFYVIAKKRNILQKSVNLMSPYSQMNFKKENKHLRPSFWTREWPVGCDERISIFWSEISFVFCLFSNVLPFTFFISWHLES